MKPPVFAPTRFLGYSQQSIHEDDIDAVVRALRSPRLTQGPEVDAFEMALSDSTASAHAVAVNSGTAALHVAYAALGVGPGDAVVVPAITFAATASAAHHLGARVIVADIDPHRGTLSPDAVAAIDDPKVKVVVPVDLGGLPADSAALREIASPRGWSLLQDASHSLGGRYRGAPVGAAMADIVTFSFHPVKPMTTAEGGAAVTQDPRLARVMMRLRSHNILRHPSELEGQAEPGYYEIHAFGHNYRMPDLLAALGRSQLSRLAASIADRQRQAQIYRENLIHPAVQHPPLVPDATSGYHLYALSIDFARLGRTRAELMQALAEDGIGTQVHYIPLYRLRAMRSHGVPGPEAFPAAEAYYQSTLSIPCFPGLSQREQAYVIDRLLTHLGRV